MKTHDCSRQGRQGRGGRFDIVPNVEMFWDPWEAGGSLTFRHLAQCRNERVDSPADVLGGMR